MYLFFPFLSVLNLSEQKKIAEHLCKKDKRELEKFQEEHFKTILSTIANLDKHFKKTKDSNKAPIGWLETTNGNYYWDEESGEIYTWVIKRIQTLSCRYKGEAPLTHYLFASLNKEWAKTDYIRHETKITGYVPPYIQRLGEDYKKIYLMLVRYKPSVSEDPFLVSKLKMKTDRYYQLKQEIESSLKSKGKSYKIQKEKYIKSLDEMKTDEEGERYYESDPDLSIEYQEYAEYMTTAFQKLDEAEQWLVELILVKERKAGEVFEMLKKDKIMKKFRISLGIKKEKSVYGALARILDKIEKQIIKSVNEKIFPLAITPSLIRQWLKNTLLYG
jgi:hypothetical protein